MVGFRVPAKDRLAVQNDSPREVGRCVVEDDDADLSRSEPGGKFGSEADANREAGWTVEAPVEEDGEVDVALAVRPPRRVTSEQVGGEIPG